MMSLKVSHLPELGQSIGWEHRRAPDQATKQELLWYFFPGDIRIESSDTVLASAVGCVAAFDFIDAMVYSKEIMGASADAGYSYPFKEIDLHLDLRRTGNDVRIECDFAPHAITVPFDVFSRAACVFVRRKIDELGSEYPALLGHPWVIELLDRCGNEQGA